MYTCTGCPYVLCAPLLMLRALSAPTYTSTVKICQSINLGIFTSPAIKTLSNPTLFGAAIPTLFNTALGFDWSSVKDTPIAGGDPFYDTTKNTTLVRLAL